VATQFGESFRLPEARFIAALASVKPAEIVYG